MKSLHVSKYPYKMIYIHCCFEAYTDYCEYIFTYYDTRPYSSRREKMKQMYVTREEWKEGE